MRRFLYLICALYFVSCAAAVKKTSPKVEEQKFRLDEWAAIEKTVPVGEVTTLELPPIFPAHYNVTCGDKNILLGAFRNGKIGFISVAYGTKVGSVIKCTVSENSKKSLIATYTVVDKDFPSERIRVDKKRVFLSKKSLKRVRKEQKFLNSNYFNPAKEALFSEGFAIPLDSYITSIYGARRVFNKKKVTKHLGTDFRAAIGTPIPAANSGRVVVSRDLFYTGNTVTIDHGLGIFTVYGHLSKMLVKEGDSVKKGQRIAFSGNTGRTSGPHLHWGIKIHNQYIDGHSLVRVTKDL